ncbi:hypothetical protein [Streptomyces sp. BE230]|uniref:hypothetical protein n=1 Tax=Streptomyces sp. BE230 TaxID=3002526 RepID=UPI002ED3B77D|nr:hypothetical protein [Streptomyces sp. BE230]
MWQGQQSPSGEPNQQKTYPGSAPEPPRRPRNRATLAVVAAATAVVVACGVTGFLVLRDNDGGKGNDPAEAKPAATGPASPDGSDRSATEAGSGPLVPGWNTVVNAKRGITFDVPASWARQSASWVSYVAEDDDPEEKPLVAMMAPAVLKEKWCTSDDNKDGNEEDTSLASTGTTGEKGSKSAAEAAEDTAKNWVYGAYTQPDRTRLSIGEPESYRTESGVEGSLVIVTSSGTPKTNKCDSDGKAMTFAFKNAAGDFVSWTYIGAHGVPDEVSDNTIRQILSTVRLFKEGDGQD